MSDGGSDWLEVSREEIAEILADLEHYRMPFGRFGPEHFPPKGVPLYDLPVEYLMYFEKNGSFPKGKLGRMMEFVYAVKMDGAEAIFAPLRRRAGDSRRLTKRRRGGR